MLRVHCRWSHVLDAHFTQFVSLAIFFLFALLLFNLSKARRLCNGLTRCSPVCVYAFAFAQLGVHFRTTVISVVERRAPGAGLVSAFALDFKIPAHNGGTLADSAAAERRIVGGACSGGESGGGASAFSVVAFVFLRSSRGWTSLFA